MNALEVLQNKKVSEVTPLEWCILHSWAGDAIRDISAVQALRAAAELQAKDAQIAAMRSELEKLQDDAVSLRLEELTPLQEQLAAKDAQIAALTSESEGRRKVLLEKAEQLRLAEICVWNLDAQTAALVRERDAAVVLLKRISAWDMLDTAADGKYWRSEIEAATARLAKGRQE